MSSPIKSHILYVEDHADTCELVCLVLTAQNYRVTARTTAEQALSTARDETFDLYLLDSWLPDGSGVELCKRLREFDVATPIVFLSGAAYEADEFNALTNGAQRYFVKPADLDLLCAEIARLIENVPRPAPQLPRSLSPADNSTAL
ncbi:MAG TPA: response regulator [Pyrinomonadaceae bacterium]|nr:response regulator [Pyrinomonadaceae bacterium]